MMKNNTFEEIAAALAQSGKILLFPHVHMDGDALGSAAALCRALRKAGKACWILIEDPIPRNLQFLDREYCTSDQDILGSPDLSVAVDCSDMERLGQRGRRFLSAEVTVCIDHHRTADSFCDLNYIDSGAAATGELIYALLETCGVSVDKEMGEALFTAIVTDTGRFQYSNTSRRTHEIAAALYDTGIDAGHICTEIYETMRMERLMIRNKALNTLSTVAGGRAVIAYVTQDMLKETGRLYGRDRRHRRGTARHQRRGSRRVFEGSGGRQHQGQHAVQGGSGRGGDRPVHGRRRTHQSRRLHFVLQLV